MTAEAGILEGSAPQYIIHVHLLDTMKDRCDRSLQKHRGILKYLLRR